MYLHRRSGELYKFGVRLLLSESAVCGSRAKERLWCLAGEALEVFDEVSLVCKTGGVRNLGKAGACLAHPDHITKADEGGKLLWRSSDRAAKAPLERALAQTRVTSQASDAQ